ncbi:MAG: polysaccharide lyase [Akkermansiaceae bacterium]|nr:polysaccharide lyase [Akkermansiaceae bacterium]
MKAVSLPLSFLLACAHGASAQQATRESATAALAKAVGFYREKVASHGGYVYVYSGDLSLREAEGIPGPDTIWIQPPGTPLVGLAFLEAYRAIGDPACARAALDAALALTRTQLHSGGWYYSGHFDAEGRRPWFYRLDPDGKPLPDPTPEADLDAPTGWNTTRQAKYRDKNETILDDNVTQAALRFLVEIDGDLKGKNAEIHDAAMHGLTALLNAQYPAGGWSASFDRFPRNPASEAEYPIADASYPADWPREWPKDFRGCYVTNDELMTRCVTTLLKAHEVYGASDPRYLEGLRKAGDFLIRAQMPDPQPAWAQQYDAEMKPCWSRAFEPPAISSRESEEILRSLLEIALVTRDKRYLEPVPKALAYLKKSELPGGRLSRFHELQTNKPLYFTRGQGGKGFVMTYDDSRVSSNYGWINESRLDAIERDFRAVSAGQKPRPERDPDLAKHAAEVIAALDDRGAWTEPGTVRNAEGKKTEPPGGIVKSETFVANVRTLCAFLETLAR